MRRFRLIHVSVVAVALASGCASPLRFQPISRPHIWPQNIYEEIAAALNHADVRLLVEFSTTGKSINFSNGLRMIIPEATEAELQVQIDDASLDHATLIFSRPIRLGYGLLPPLQFQHIHVDASGTIQRTDLRFARVHDNILLWPFLFIVHDAVRENIRINTRGFDLLTGNVFATNDGTETAQAEIFGEGPIPISTVLAAFHQDAVRAADNSDQRDDIEQVPPPEESFSLSDIVSRVTLRVRRADLIPGTPLLFTNYPAPGEQADCESTRVVVDDGSHVEIPFAEFIPETNSLEAFANLDLKLLSSVLVTRGHRFYGRSGSRLLATGLHFTRTPDSWSFGTAGGYAELTLSGTDLKIGESFLEIKEGSSLVLRDFRISADAGEPVSVSGCGAIDLVVKSGTLRFNDSQLVLDDNSVLRFDAQLDEDGQGTLQLRGLVRKLDLRIVRGDFDLQGAGKVSIGEGSRLLTHGMRVNTRNAWNFEGPIELLSLQDIGGRLNLNAGSFVTLGDDSSLTLANVAVSALRPHYTGTLSFDLKAVAGHIDMKNDSFIELARGELFASAMHLEENAPNPISGVLEKLLCTVQAASLGFGMEKDADGKLARFSLAEGSSVQLLSLTIPKVGNDLHGSLVDLDVRVSGGHLYAGNGTLITLTDQSLLKAAALQFDNRTGNKIHGTVDQFEAAAAGGVLPLNGATRLFFGPSTVKFASLYVPPDGNSFTGTLRFDLQMTGGSDFDYGGFSTRLAEGTAKGQVVWTIIEGCHATEANLESLVCRFGIRAPHGTTAPELEYRMKNVVVSGSYRELPYVERMTGSLALIGVDDINSAPVIPIPPFSGRKVTEVPIQLRIPRSWQLLGDLAFDSAGGPSRTHLLLQPPNPNAPLFTLMFTQPTGQTIGEKSWGKWIFKVGFKVVWNRVDALPIEVRLKKALLNRRGVAIQSSLDIKGKIGVDVQLTGRADVVELAIKSALDVQQLITIYVETKLNEFIGNLEFKFK